jgi:hypothetical protein
MAITITYLQELFTYDDGKLFWKIKRKGSNGVGTRVGTQSPDGYRYVGIDRNRFLEHRIIWLMLHGWLPQEVDHINMVKNDNRIENLRAATSSLNHCNKTKHPRNTSGFKGVSYFKRDGNWAAHICFNRKQKNLGLFATPELAHDAYKKAAIELHGEFAKF